jgi:hypothetical protein
VAMFRTVLVSSGRICVTADRATPFVDDPTAEALVVMVKQITSAEMQHLSFFPFQ